MAGYEQLSVTAALRDEAVRGVVGLSYFHIPLRETLGDDDDDARIVAGHLDALAEMAGLRSRPEHSSIQQREDLLGEKQASHQRKSAAKLKCSLAFAG